MIDKIPVGVCLSHFRLFYFFRRRHTAHPGQNAGLVTYSNTVKALPQATEKKALPSAIGAFGQLEPSALGAEKKVESSLVPCISGILTRLTPTVYILTGLSGVFCYF